MVRKKLVATIGIIVVAIAITAALYWQYQWVAPPEKEKTLIVGTLETVEGGVDPARNRGHLAYNLACTVGEGLWGVKSNSMELEPRLATSYEIIDEKTWEFKLREDVKFHDGTPFNASAVKFSLDRTMEMKKGLSFLLTTHIESVEVVDEYTVRIHLLHPYGGLLSGCLANSPACIGSPTATQKWGEEFGITGYAGTGPFKLVSFTLGEEVVLEANKEYWNKERIPKVDRIIFKIFPDGTTLRLAMEEGELDIAYRHIPLPDIPTLEAVPGIEMIKAPDSYVRYLAFSARHPYTNDTLVRKAIAYAIDYDTIFELRSGARAYSFMDEEMYPWTLDYQKNFTYNPEKAKELLTQAGYPDGIPEKLELWYTPLHFGVEEGEMAAVIQSNLKDIGIELELHSAEYTAMTSYANEGMLQMVLFSESGGSYLDADVIFAWDYLSSGVSNTRFGHDYGPEVDEMIIQARASADPQKRIEFYTEAQEVIHSSVLCLYLYRTWNYLFYWERVEGVHLSPCKVNYIIDWTLLSKEA